MSPTYSICKNHGYLAGEQETCPDCGCKTEIYSRITGYYRPVQNWNDGKLQEFKNRKEYDINLSLTKSDEKDTLNKNPQETTATSTVNDAFTTSMNDAAAYVQSVVPQSTAAAPASSSDAKVLLFTTKTCPNCAIAKEYLGSMPYKLIDALEEPELATKYGVKMAPTLVVDNGSNVKMYVRASEIKQYVDENKRVLA